MKLGIFLGKLFLAIACTSALIADEPACVKNLETHFYDPSLLEQALGMHDFISQSTWPEINRVLQSKVSEVPRMMRERAQQMKPNPFNIPYDPVATAKLFGEVQLEFLTSILVQFNIADPNEIHQIYSYVRENQMPKLRACFGDEVMDEVEGIKKPKATGA